MTAKDKTVDELIDGLLAARVAAVRAADSQLEFADNAEIARTANKLLEIYKAQAKAQLYELISSVIGEDEPDGSLPPDDFYFKSLRNQLRAEQRKVLKDLFGEGE